MRLICCVAIVLSFVGPTASRAQEKGAFVVRLGSDTLSLEQVTRTATHVRGEYVTRAPRTAHRTYTADLNPDGTIRRFEMLTRYLSSGPGPAETRTTLEFTGDSAITNAPRGDSTVTTGMAAGKGAVPWVQGVMGSAARVPHSKRT